MLPVLRERCLRFDYPPLSFETSSVITRQSRAAAFLEYARSKEWRDGREVTELVAASSSATLMPLLRLFTRVIKTSLGTTLRGARKVFREDEREKTERAIQRLSSSLLLVHDEFLSG